MANGSAWGQASKIIGKTIQTTLTGIQKEVAQRTYRAANELRNSSLYVLRGQRSGRVYKLPKTDETYTASAPGEPPAARTGVFRDSWGTHARVEKQGKDYQAVASIESHEMAGGKPLGEILENGGGRIKPRPYKQNVIERALPKIKQIYSKPYHP